MVTYEELKDVLRKTCFRPEILEPTIDRPFRSLKLSPSPRMSLQGAFTIFLQDFEKDQELLRGAKHYALLQVLYSLPISLKEGGTAELPKLLNLLNKACFFPGYGYDEVENTIFFRHALVVPKDEPLSTGMMPALLEDLQAQIGAYEETILAVVYGNQSLKVILTEAQGSSV